MGQSPWLDYGFPYSAQPPQLLPTTCAKDSGALVKGLTNPKCITHVSVVSRGAFTILHQHHCGRQWLPVTFH